ncbi:hypothetical protein ACLB2K_037182 [Fragaria x ananassa]
MSYRKPWNSSIFPLPTKYPKFHSALSSTLLLGGLIPNTVSDMSRVPLSDAEREEGFQRALAKLISHPGLPPNFVASAEFGELIKVVNPNFKPNIQKGWDLSVKILRYENPANGYCVDDYLCLFAHFVDENWKLQKGVLHSHALELKAELSPSEFLHDDDTWGVFRWLEDFGIEKKISTLSMVNDDVGFDQLVGCVKNHIQEKKAGEYSSADPDYVPTPEEWKKVEGVCKIVDCIYEVSNALFQAKHQTANVLGYNVLAAGNICSFGSSVQDVEFACSKVKGADGTHGSSQAAAVLGTIEKLFDEYTLRLSEKVNCTSQSSASVSDSEGASPRYVNHTFSVLQDFKKFTQLKGYLEEPVLPWSTDFDALAWWGTAGTNEAHCMPLVVLGAGLLGSERVLGGSVVDVFKDMSGVPEANEAIGCGINGVDHENDSNVMVFEYDHEQRDLKALAELICSGEIQPEMVENMKILI